MRVYISGPITGTEDYQERFAKAQEHLESQGYTVINPALVDMIMPADATYDEYMCVDYCLLDMCDTIYMLEGWEKSPGANRELGFALAKHHTIMRENVK
ncbi:MAG: DUF4406 domain-containing protein [Lachnospiraceae bacterium]|nr:DUF4406 domain-containing protein [Lachnospiraceae bacterium]